MYKLAISELAHDDLDKIIYYIAVELASPVAATNFADLRIKYSRKLFINTIFV